MKKTIRIKTEPNGEVVEKEIKKGASTKHLL